MEHSIFDIENGLARPTNASLPMPDNINNLVESAVVNHPAPTPAPGPPNALQHPPLGNRADRARDLSEFQEAELEQFGDFSREFVSSGDEIAPQDYYDTDQDSEDELNMEDRARPAREPNPRISPDQQMQERDRVTQQCERRSVAEKQQLIVLNLIHIDSEKVEQVQYWEFHESEEVNVESVLDQGLMAEEVLTRDHPAGPELPPIEEKFTKELNMQMNPFSAEVSVSLTVAASPQPASELPGTSNLTIEICQSSLEIKFASAAADGTSISEGSVKEGAESVKKPAV